MKEKHKVPQEGSSEDLVGAGEVGISRKEYGEVRGDGAGVK